MQQKTKRRLLTALGLIVAGVLAGNAFTEPHRRIKSWADGLMRRLLFQSKKESVRTESRSTASLATDLAHSVYSRFMSHNVMSVAASSSFYMVLAIFPGLAALVALYGFLGDPADIETFVASMPNIIPHDVIGLVQGFLQRLISRPSTNLYTFIIGLIIAMWSANAATKSLIEALNVVYERREERSFLKINLIATIMTLTSIAFLIVAINIMILPVWDWLIDTFGIGILRLRWIALLFAVQVLISALYYFAPCGHQKHFHLLTAGASLAAISWVVMSMGFTAYLTNFANYSITYGSLGAAAIFMTWLWLTVMVLLIGAEVDAALERLGAEEAD